jgi:23S rRNA pseudouridine2457 synthase
MTMTVLKTAKPSVPAAIQGYCRVYLKTRKIIRIYSAPITANITFSTLQRFMLLAFSKPYGVLSQFTPDGSRHRSLTEFGFPPGVYPIGRLDADSEGLLLLSNEPVWNARLLDPEQGHEREYWVQVERVPSSDALQRLARGIVIGNRRTRPARVVVLNPPPELPARLPPVRFRKTVPDCWLSLVLQEGRNRQVRRMTAAVGHPTLRLVRWRIGEITLGTLAPGIWRELDRKERASFKPFSTSPFQNT